VAKKTRKTEQTKKNEKKVCIVGYKRAIISSGHVYGEVFDKLEPCCDQFKRLFFDTGQNKISIFKFPVDEREGLNLVTRGDALTLVLRISRSPGVIYEGKVSSCLFCGRKVVVKCTKSVELIPRKKEVPDGYTEEVKWQEGEQAQ